MGKTQMLHPDPSMYHRTYFPYFPHSLPLPYTPAVTRKRHLGKPLLLNNLPYPSHLQRFE